MNYKKAEKGGEKKTEERGEDRDNNDMKWEGRYGGLSGRVASRR